MKNTRVTKKQKLAKTIKQMEQRIAELRKEQSSARRSFNSEMRLLDSGGLLYRSLREYELAVQVIQKASDVIAHHIRILDCASDEAIIKGTAELRAKWNVNQTPLFTNHSLGCVPQSRKRLPEGGGAK